MNQENIQILIIRLFTGEASTAEKAEVRTWLNRSDKNKKLFEDLREIWLQTEVEYRAEEYDTEKAIQVFKHKIRRYKETKVRRFSPLNLLKYAAILLLVLALPVMYYSGKNSVVLPPQTFTSVSCAYGDKSQLTLPDGSVVHLNSGSSLTFSNDFTRGQRVAKLSGEGYFSIVKNPENPFIVKTGDIEIEVLGTEFNLKSYPEDHIISTTLVEGSLRVSSPNQSAIINPNQKITYSKSSKTLMLYQLSETDAETEWKEGRLVFRNESLADLELKLERWFDVDIEFADEGIKNRHFSGTLERESILETLSYFGHSKYVGYKINANEITFYSKN